MYVTICEEHPINLENHLSNLKQLCIFTEAFDTDFIFSPSNLSDANAGRYRMIMDVCARQDKPIYSTGLQPNSGGLQPNSGGLQPNVQNRKAAKVERKLL